MENLDFIDLILLLAAAQSLFLTLFLLHRHSKPVPNRFLILLIFSYSVILSEMVLEEMGFWDTRRYLVPIILGIVFIMVPTHYYYALHLSRPDRPLRATDLLHLLPFAILQCWQLGGLLLGHDSLQEYFAPSLGGITLFNAALLTYSLVYMALTLVRLRRHEVKSRHYLSNLGRSHFRWLVNLTWLTITILLVFTLENLLLLRGIEISFEFTLTSLLVAVFVYAISYQVLLHPEVLVIPAAETGHPQSEEYEEERLETRQIPAAERYQKSGLSTERAEEIRQQLLVAMESEKLYRDPDLTLRTLAHHLNVTPHNLSEVINLTLKRNFFDLINQYRVDQMKNDLLDPAKEHLKLLALAYDAGFSSKSTFNLLFKKHAGMTPTEYRQRNK